MSKVQDHGEPDKELENGPIDKRECRDVLCCLMFIAAIVVGIYVFIRGVQNGDPNKLIALYDYDGQGCGMGKAAQYPLMYYPNVLSQTT